MPYRVYIQIDVVSENQARSNRDDMRYSNTMKIAMLSFLIDLYVGNS